MVVKLETVPASVMFTNAKFRGAAEEYIVDCPRRQKMRRTALPALVEAESEPETYEPQEPCRLSSLRAEALRRQKSSSPPRKEKLRRQLVLPSLSEDEEP